MKEKYKIMKKIMSIIHLVVLMSVANGSAEETVVFRDLFEKGWTLSNQCNKKVVAEAAGQSFQKGVLVYNFQTPGQDAVLIAKEANIPLKTNSVIKVTYASDGSKQRFFMVLRDKNGESFFIDGGRMLAAGERTVIFAVDKLFTPPRENTGEIWGGDGNRSFDSPATGITLGIDNYPDKVNRQGSVKLTALEAVDNPDVSREREPELTSQAVFAKLPGEDTYQNIVTNSSFEDGELNKGPVGWGGGRGVLTKVGGGADGRYCAKWVMKEGVRESLGAFISQLCNVPGGLKQGDIWLFTARLRTGKRAMISMAISDFPDNVYYSDHISLVLSPEDGWQTFCVPYRVRTSSNSLLKPHIYVYQSNAPLYIDDVKIYKLPEGVEFTSKGIRPFITEAVIVPEKFEE